MEFMADENVPRPLIDRLRRDGFQVYAIIELGAGAPDREVLRTARTADLVLITQDTDFGELAVVGGAPIAGVVLFRLARLPLGQQVERVSAVLRSREHRLVGALTVIEPGRVRMRPLPAAE